MTEVLHSYAQGPVLVLFALLTQLGDVWFLFALGGALYVAGTEFLRLEVGRRQGLFVLALALTYVALVGALKTLFALPRPPGATVAPPLPWLPGALSVVYERAATATGSGFPSGHALGSTMVWGGVALVLDDHRDVVRFGLAGTVVAAISLSRLFLGVHYAVDVVVGAALGVVVLWACYRLADGGRDPGRVLLVAVLIGVAGLVPGITFDSVAAVGSAVGAWLTWRLVADPTPIRPGSRGEIGASAGVLLAAAAVFGAVYAFRPAVPVTLVGSALATGGAVAAPYLGERLV